MARQRKMAVTNHNTEQLTHTHLAVLIRHSLKYKNTASQKTFYRDTNFGCLQRFQKAEDRRQCRHDKRGGPKAKTQTDRRRDDAAPGLRAPGFSCLRQQLYLTEWRPLLTGLGLGGGTPLPAAPAASRARRPRSCAGWDVHSVPPPQKASSGADAFLLPGGASGSHWASGRA